MSTTELLSEVRELEDEVDTLKCLIKDFDNFLIGCNASGDGGMDREIGELQERIRSCFEDDEELVEEQSLMDEYRDKGVSPSDFH